MTFLIDNNEPDEFDYWLGQSFPVKRGAFNQTSGNPIVYPDFTIQTDKRIIGVNRKQAVEWMGGFNAWKDQVLRELNGPVDYLYQVIEGAITSTPRDGVWGWDTQDPDIHKSYKGNTDIESGGGHSEFYGHVSQWDYKALMGEIIRLTDAGIYTFFTSGVFGTSQFLIELHKIAALDDWEPRCLTQLVKTKYMISETEIVRRNMILFLMGIPSVGEAVATALVDYFPTFHDLFDYISSGMRIASIPLASKNNRNRTIGPATEAKIREFWGLGNA